MNRLAFRIAFGFLMAAAVAACGGGGGSAPGPSVTPTPVPSSPTPKPTTKPTSTPVPTPTPVPTNVSSAIKHVVVIIQENRSFDNLFMGFPNAQTQNFGLVERPGSSPASVPLSMVPLAVTCDISHAHTSWSGDWDGGNMDGFSASTSPLTCPKNSTPPPSNYAYSYVNPTDVAPYWAMAQSYTLMDNVFEDPTAPSFEAHLHLISGQSNNGSENPQINGVIQTVWGCDSPAGTVVPTFNGLADSFPGISPCFPTSYPTIADLLDGRGLSWRYYAPSVGAAGDIWSIFDAIPSVRYGPDWNADVVSPETLVLSQASALPAVTYVVPSFADSDHAGSNSDTGPSWVAAVVNAIGASQNWSSTAIFVVWDDWGGWYDHMAPPVSANYTEGGFRVPVLCISPYSQNPNPASPIVDHSPHGMDGILSFIEQTFSLPNLGAQDALDSPLNDCFNFKQAPKPFVAIPATKYPASYFRNERASGLVPDSDE